VVSSKFLFNAPDGGEMVPGCGGPAGDVQGRPARAGGASFRNARAWDTVLGSGAKGR